MATIELTADAEQDLSELYLASLRIFGEAQTERYIATLQDKLQTAAEHPDFAVDYSFVRRGLRRYETGSHSIYFRQIEGGIRILRILHGRMDPARHL